jgi:DNA-binding PadR family transcriptional regulator
LYELIVLGLLMRWPRHGYLIARIVNDVIGPRARMSNGGLYPLLNRLEASGLIVSQAAPDSPSGERRQRVFAITDTGRHRFRELMLDVTSNPGEYQKVFWLKALFLDLVESADRLALLDNYVGYCEAHLAHLQAREEARRRRAVHLDPADEALRERAAGHPYLTPQHLRLAADGMRHRADHWQLDLAWAQRLRDDERAASRDAAPATAAPATRA